MEKVRESAWKERSHESSSGMALYLGGDMAQSWLWRLLGVRLVEEIQSLVLPELEGNRGFHNLLTLWFSAS